MIPRTARLAAVLSFAVVACGGDGAGTGPLTTADATELCTRDCERKVRCQDPPVETVEACTSECVADLGSWIRADVATDYLACTATLACGASDDACSVCAPTSSHEDFGAACLANLASCDVDLESLCAVTITPSTSGDAGFVCTITPAIVDELTACIPAGVTCAAALACLDATFGRYGIDA